MSCFKIGKKPREECQHSHIVCPFAQQQQLAYRKMVSSGLVNQLEEYAEHLDDEQNNGLHLLDADLWESDQSDFEQGRF